MMMMNGPVERQEEEREQQGQDELGLVVGPEQQLGRRPGVEQQLLEGLDQVAAAQVLVVLVIGVDPSHRQARDDPLRHHVEPGEGDDEGDDPLDPLLAEEETARCR